ncbi:unnamed protein product [Effrenium voratum]|nr:unnamed protein product [Effrenium voratum]
MARDQMADRLEALLGKVDFKHLESVKPTRVLLEVKLIEKARIPSLKVESKPHPVPESSTITVEQISGVSTKVAIPAPHTVATLKQVLESTLQIPAFLQIIVAGSQELIDSDAISAEAVTLLRREPPMISTEAFLESMVYGMCRWKLNSIFARWYQLDMDEPIPQVLVPATELLRWTMQFCDSH